MDLERVHRLHAGEVPNDDQKFVSRPKQEVGAGGYDYLAPDGSEIRLLPEVSGGGLCHCSLPPGKVSRPKYHRTVEEIWYFVSGQGEVWRRDESDEIQTTVSQGTALNIPRGVPFQFRNTGTVPLRLVIATIPRWPGKEAGETEAVEAQGPWVPTA